MAGKMVQKSGEKPVDMVVFPIPGDSSRDLFIPCWRSQKSPLKGSRELTIPKRPQAELPGYFRGFSTIPGGETSPDF